MRSLVRLPFVIVLVLAIVLVAIQPGLLPWLGIALAIVLVCILAPHISLSRRLLIILGAIALVIVIIVVVVVVTSSSEKKAPPPARVQGTQMGAKLDAQAVYDTKKATMKVHETLTIDRTELEKAAESDLLTEKQRARLSLDQIETSVAAGLTSQGWQPRRTTNALVAVHEVLNPATQHEAVPGVTSNKFHVDVPDRVQVIAPRTGETAHPTLPVTFRVLEGSKLVIKAPKHAIKATEPHTDAKPAGGDDEKREIALKPDMNRTFEYDLRAKLFRHDGLAPITDWLLWSIFPWLFALAIALSNGAVRDRIRELAGREPRETVAKDDEDDEDEDDGEDEKDKSAKKEESDDDER